MCQGNQTQVSTPATSPVTVCPGSLDSCPYALPAAPASTLVAVSAIPEPCGGFTVIYCPIVCAGITPAFNGLPPCLRSKADVCQDNLENCKDVLENVKSYREEEEFYELQSRVVKDHSNQLAELADEIPSEELKKTRTGSSRRVRTNRWPFPLVEVPPCPLPGWKEMPYGLERYWREGFALMFLEWFHPGTGHTWTLTPVSELPAEDPEGWPWHQIGHRAKVRFSCQYSGHGWTSMNGLVAFAFRLRRQGDDTIGEVVFKLYGQQCNRCAAERAGVEPNFETPLWYPEEIYLALLYLKKKIGETYYGYERILKTPQGIRPGKPKHPHLPEKCQACRDGLCRARCS